MTRHSPLFSANQLPEGHISKGFFSIL